MKIKVVLRANLNRSLNGVNSPEHDCEFLQAFPNSLTSTGQPTLAKHVQAALAADLQLLQQAAASAQLLQQMQQDQQELVHAAIADDLTANEQSQREHADKGARFARRAKLGLLTAAAAAAAGHEHLTASSDNHQAWQWLQVGLPWPD